MLGIKPWPGFSKAERRNEKREGKKVLELYMCTGSAHTLLQKEKEKHNKMKTFIRMV